MSLEGHPIVGDSLYGPEEQPVPRQFLHAYKLIVKNPETLEDMTIEISLPNDMNEFLNIK